MHGPHCPADSPAAQVRQRSTKASGQSGVPNDRNQAGPSGEICAARQTVSALSTTAGLIRRPARTRDEAVERALAAGAAILGDHRKEDGTGWVTLTDPEGNEFCIERGEAERGPRASAAYRIG